MRGVLLDVPDSLIAERARLGLDRHDGMGDGVLHAVAADKGAAFVVGDEFGSCRSAAAPGPLDIGYGASVTVEDRGVVAVSCAAGTWRA